MAKNTKQENMQIMTDAIQKISAIISTTIKKVPTAIPLLEEQSEQNPNTFSDAVVQLFKGYKELSENDY